MIVNLTNKRYIAHNPFFAINFSDRIRGMIGRRFDAVDFDAMVFTGCNAIHTFFMSQKIDVLFLDSDNKVVGLRKNLARWLMLVRYTKAVTIIELPEGVIEHSGTEIGHVINVSEELVAGLSTLMVKKNMAQEMESVVPYSENDK
ncbi:MAG: DUF192 domain-containing protein [Victivallales bacterium]|nr:DUF192 domain-containing protein [Victivallales bacterium]